MVVVPKGSGKVRICVNLKPLNESVMRELHPLPKVDSTLPQFAGAKIFSKIDTNSGFWQVPLSAESKLLTTFVTPYGRFCFNKLPFGISSAPEHFQRCMSELVADIPGVLCHIDDIVIFGDTQEEHDERLHAVLQRIQREGLTLNPAKREFSKPRIHFLGHVIDANGVQPNPAKTDAVQKMSSPTSLSELRRIMGMLNQLNKFSPKLTELAQPLRELLSPKRAWLWTSAHEEAFRKIKEEVSSPRVLTHYALDKDTKISADASLYGLGAVLLQLHKDDGWRPVAFTSRALTETEARYAQIEKEALALTWACEKFSDYILGKPILLETDHKPLVPILGSKSLETLPPRVLRFRLCLARFQYTVHYSPGKSLYLADTLSRAPLKVPSEGLNTLTDQEVENFVEAVVSSLPASADRINVYRQAQARDTECRTLIEYCKSGWPEKHKVKGELKRFWQVRGELTCSNDLLLFRSRIIVPKSLRGETLQKIHTGHQGIVCCRLRVAESVWWPGVSHEVEHFIKSCAECQKNTVPPREPLISSDLPSYPWEKVASDLFEMNKCTYLLVVDYFSKYVEVQKLSTTTAANVIAALKSIFSRHGIPSILVSDNGPQYSSYEMKEFDGKYGFQHVTSSPLYPQANGQAERAVKTVKQLLGNAKDPHMAL